MIAAFPMIFGTMDFGMQACPNLFLIGAQKGGSSTLARQLIRHPAIAFQSVKEPNFFIAPSLDACRAQLLQAGPPTKEVPYSLDASVNYTRYPLQPHVPETILRICGPDEPRFLYILRHPFDRAVSEYYWKREHFGEYRSIDAALTPESQYVLTGCYDLQISRYLAHFARDRFLFLTFDDHIRDPQGSCDAIFDWLGLERTDLGAQVTLHRGRTNQAVTKEARLRAVNRLVYASPALRRAVKSVLPHRMLRRVTDMLSRPTMREAPPANLRQHLMQEIFADSIAWRRRRDRPGPVRLAGLRRHPRPVAQSRGAHRNRERQVKGGFPVGPGAENQCLGPHGPDVRDRTDLQRRMALFQDSD